MPDDDHLGGARSGDPQGYGRRHRRAAEEPEEQPRRRRRSMEDNSEGLSVADLVQRHSTSRTNLPLPPQPPPAPGGRRAMAPPPNQPSNQPQPSPRGRPAEGPPPVRGARPGELPPNGHPGQPPRVRPGPRPGEATGGPQAWPEEPPAARRAPGQASGPRPGRQPSGPLPGERPAGRPQAGPLPGGRETVSPPPASRRNGRQPSGPLPPADFPGEFPADRHPAVPPPPVERPGGRPDFPAERAGGRPTDFPGGRPVPPPADFPDPAGSPNPPHRPPSGRHPSGPLPGGPPPGRRPGPSVDDFPSGPPRPAGPVPEHRQPGPEADLPPGARESGIRRALNGPEDDQPAPGPRAPGQAAGRGPVPLPPPRRPEQDAISMTTEMEAIGEEVQKRRSIDHTLARFSAVHDELKAEEREKKSKRRMLMPWQQQDDEMDALDEMVGMQTIAVPQKAGEPEPAAEPEPETRLQKKKSKRRNRSAAAGRIFAIVAAVSVFVGTGIAWGFKSWIDASAQQVDALDPNSAAIQDAAAQRGDENFLLVGSDTRAGAAAEEGVGDENEVVGARSDTVMIAHIPKNRERVVIVSFPRDLEVTRPECERWDAKSGKYTGETDPGGEQVKINTAYQVGGPMCVTKMVQELSGLAINHFVGIDFHGFKDMVDAVEGVQVCVERPLKDEVLGTVVPQAGKNVTISGDQALNFVRARKVEGDPTSDYGRIKRQQRFLSSLLRKAMSSEVLLDPGKLTGFVDAFSKSTFGDNIGVDQMFVLGQSMQGIEAGRVTFVTVPTVGEANDNGNEDLRVEDTDALFRAIRDDSPLPGETPKDAPKDNNQGTVQPNAQMASGLRFQQEQPAPVDPKTVKIQVLNGGNDQDGIAGDTASELADLGFQVVSKGPSLEQVDKTVIKYSKVKAAQAQTLAAAVPGAQLVEDPTAGGAIQLIIGPGFDGEVVSPTGGGGEPPPELPADLSTVNAGDVSCA